MRSSLLISIAIGIVSLEIVNPQVATGEISDWEISGQVRPRMEYRNGYRTLLPPGTTDGVVFISQRTRLGVLYKGEAKARILVQVQDVRTWGDELHTSSDATADKFDLHQGYLDLMPHENWTFRIGRQEISYDEERLIGTGNWNQPGRSHDAIRVMWQSGKTSVHAAWAHHEKGEPVSWVPYTNPANYQDLAFLRIGTATVHSSVSGLLIFDAFEPRDSPTHTYAPRWTGGAYAKFMIARTSLRGEVYYQTGEAELINPHLWSRRDLSAFFLGISATQKLGSIGTTLWYDYLSGDNNPNDDRLELFDPLYGTFHRFYGWADYFISFPNDTRGLGLQDLALKVAIDGPRSATTQVDFHYFWLAETSTNAGIEDRHLGFEADLRITIPLLKSVSLSGGASLVLPTRELRELKGNADQGHWIWTMLDFNVK